MNEITVRNCVLFMSVNLELILINSELKTKLLNPYKMCNVKNTVAIR